MFVLVIGLYYVVPLGEIFDCRRNLCIHDGSYSTIDYNIIKLGTSNGLLFARAVGLYFSAVRKKSVGFDGKIY